MYIQERADCTYHNIISDWDKASQNANISSQSKLQYISTFQSQICKSLSAELVVAFQHKNTF